MPTFAIREEAMREPHAGMEAGHTRPDTEAAHATNRTLNSMVSVAWKARKRRPDDEIASESFQNQLPKLERTVESGRAGEYVLRSEGIDRPCHRATIATAAGAVVGNSPLLPLPSSFTIHVSPSPRPRALALPRFRRVWARAAIDV
eukprot:scaffold73085_cov63-Phaeocystis_antarctica.AAC.2